MGTIPCGAGLVWDDDEDDDDDDGTGAGLLCCVRVSTASTRPDDSRERRAGSGSKARNSRSISAGPTDACGKYTAWQQIRRMRTTCGMQM